MSEPERAPSVGATGGLPGANAAPEASRLPADELAVVQSGDLQTTPTDPVTGRDVDELAGPDRPARDDDRTAREEAGPQ